MKNTTTLIIFGTTLFIMSCTNNEQETSIKEDEKTEKAIEENNIEGQSASIENTHSKEVKLLSTICSDYCSLQYQEPGKEVESTLIYISQEEEIPSDLMDNETGSLNEKYANKNAVINIEKRKTEELGDVLWVTKIVLKN